MTTTFAGNPVPFNNLRFTYPTGEGPEPAYGISVGVAKKAVRDWTNRNHKF
jgi:hypothetical protein